MTSGAKGALRDADIRAPLSDWLLSHHAGDPETALIHEFKMPRPSARTDLALINGRMEAYEIKSDVDSLARLPRQIVAFARIFDRVAVVTTDRHLKIVRRTVPDWCAVLVARKRNGRLRFEKSQRGRRIKDSDRAALLHTLDKRELSKVLSAHGSKGLRRHSKQALVDMALALQVDVRGAVRSVLRERSDAVSAAAIRRPAAR